MEEIKTLIKNCKLCGENPKLTENSLQRGKTNFIIIGESPAKDGWIVSNRAFYNKLGKLQASGRVLEKLLNNIGLKIEDIYFTEFCKCIVPDRKDLFKFCHNCKPVLYKQLEKIPCKIMITMGLAPTQAILGRKIEKFADIVGKQINVQVNDKDFLLIPIYHPSPLNPKGYKGNVPIFQSIKNLINAE